MKSALEIIKELTQHIDKTYAEEKRHRGFLICVAEDTPAGVNFSHQTNMPKNVVDTYHATALGAIIGYKGKDTNELPRPERMHSDRCRTAIRSSKDSGDAN